MARFSTELQKFFFSPTEILSETVVPVSDLTIDADPCGPVISTTTVSPDSDLDISSNSSLNEDAPQRDDDQPLANTPIAHSIPDVITVMDVLDLAGERTFGVLLALMALPSALPIPAPGYSTPFGLVIVLLATQMMIGRHRPWFPGFVRNSSIKRHQAQQVVALGLPWLRRLEAVSRPRFSVVCNSKVGHISIGLVMVLMGICMMIPIPGTNTIPAMIVFILGFSLIEEDGLISIAGLTAGLFGGVVVAIAFVKGLPLFLTQVQSFTHWIQKH